MAKNMTNYKREFGEKNYDRLAITIPKGQKEVVDAHAKSKGLSTNGLVNELLRNELGLAEEEWRAKSAEALEE